MGRYYSGDIEGKFWFGVQSSTDADFFGATGYEPNYVEYYFTEDELPDIKAGLATCKKELGRWLKDIDKFFEEVNGYNDQIIAEHGFNVKEFNEKLTWYARYKLGKKIYDCVKKNGSCEFQAEL